MLQEQTYCLHDTTLSIDLLVYTKCCSKSGNTVYSFPSNEKRWIMFKGKSIRAAQLNVFIVKKGGENTQNVNKLPYRQKTAARFCSQSVSSSLAMLSWRHLRMWRNNPDWHNMSSWIWKTKVYIGNDTDMQGAHLKSIYKSV